MNRVPLDSDHIIRIDDIGPVYADKVVRKLLLQLRQLEWDCDTAVQGVDDGSVFIRGKIYDFAFLELMPAAV